MNTTSFMKRSEVVSNSFMQMPRWLFDDQNYNTLSLPAKVAYMFLFNRCQLSQHNGWVNNNDEVYIIFTREELAKKMQVSYKKAISCFVELQDAGLIHEERRGRGMPNQIYLIQIECPVEAENAVDSESSESTNDSAINPAETESPVAETPVDKTEDAVHNSSKTVENETAIDSNSDVETSAGQGLNYQIGTSRPVNSAVQDLSFLHPSYINKNYINYNHTGYQSVRQSNRGGADSIILKDLLDNCDLDKLYYRERPLMKEAITWLFYADGLQMGLACYPQEYVRSRLNLLDYDVLSDALYKFYKNQTRIHGNALCYAAKVLFSCLTERNARRTLNLGAIA